VAVTDSLDDVRTTKGRYWGPVALWMFLCGCSLQKDWSVKMFRWNRMLQEEWYVQVVVLWMVTPCSLLDGYVVKLIRDCALLQPTIPQSEKLVWYLERMLCSLQNLLTLKDGVGWHNYDMCDLHLGCQEFRSLLWTMAILVDALHGL
jgi:hypothetical protein